MPAYWEYVPEIIAACERSGMINQTDLTVATWGESGRGNSTLTSKIFPALVDLGLLSMKKEGRVKWFSATQKGVERAKKIVEQRGYPAVII